MEKEHCPRCHRVINDDDIDENGLCHRCNGIADDEKESMEADSNELE